MTTTQKHTSDEFIHAGGGAGLLFIQLSALIPGLLPTVALAAVLLIPLVAVALAGALLFAIPWSLWRLTAAVTRPRRRGDDAHLAGSGSAVAETAC